MARTKAQTVWEQDLSLPVLGADTTVVLDGKVFGKPADRADALRMLGLLSGRTHDVLTAVALASRGRPVDARERERRALPRRSPPTRSPRTGRPANPRRQGRRYAIQGLGAVFIESLTGSSRASWDCRCFETSELLRAAGVPCWGTMGA